MGSLLIWLGNWLLISNIAHSEPEGRVECRRYKLCFSLEKYHYHTENNISNAKFVFITRKVVANPQGKIDTSSKNSSVRNSH